MHGRIERKRSKLGLVPCLVAVLTNDADARLAAYDEVVAHFASLVALGVIRKEAEGLVLRRPMAPLCLERRKATVGRTVFLMAAAGEKYRDTSGVLANSWPAVLRPLWASRVRAACKHRKAAQLMDSKALRIRLGLLATDTAACKARRLRLKNQAALSTRMA
jgi:hypothetical protein